MEQVLLNDFRRLPAHVKAALSGAFAGVVDSAHYILGKQVARFEADWARHCGTAHAIGVGNGMDAIEIGLRLLDLQPGDEVITTSMTAFASTLGILRAGATPVIADIDPTTGCMDPKSAERCIGPKTRAILLVHLYGQICAIDQWQALCAKHKILLLEDAAQAHEAAWNGVRAGSLGLWAAYSFYPTKNLGCIGDGGALCLNDAGMAKKASQLRNYGQSERYHHPLEGLNSRLDEVQAALLNVLLPELSGWTARRQQVAETYHACIESKKVRLLAAPQARENHVYHLFVVATDDRAALMAHLQKWGVQTLIHYPVCIHEQPPTSGLRRDPKGLRSAEKFAREVLSLPCNPFLTNEEVRRVVDAVNAF